MKFTKRMCIVCIVSLCASVIAAVSVGASLSGDANSDGTVTAMDLQKLFRQLLAEEAYTATGRVSYADGTPVPEAVVTISSTTLSEPIELQTNKNGVFTCCLRDGKYNVTVNYADFESVNKRSYIVMNGADVWGEEIKIGEEIIDYGRCGSDLMWSLDKSGTMTISGTGNMWDWQTRDSVPWYYLRTQIKKLVICEGVTSIGTYAFYDCANVKGNLVIPEGITSIGYRAFYQCTGFSGNIVIPDSVTQISEYAFYGCSGFKGNLILGNGLITIGNHAFQNCSGVMGSLSLGANIVEIGEAAFDNCYSLSGSLLIPDSVEQIQWCAFANCYGFTGDLIIGDGKTNIGKAAFDNCFGFTGCLYIGKNVIGIGAEAFKGCNNFSKIEYAGSEAQWNSVNKGANWYNGQADITYTNIDASEQ